MPVGKEYPASARYNALFACNKLIHNSKITDPEISRLNPDCEIIQIEQGYTRCNLVALSDHSFITSDRGIEKVLRHFKMEVLYVDPTSIQLEGFEHGFFGGACGIHNQTLFVCGSLKFLKEKTAIGSMAAKAGLAIVELYSGYLVDVGTILFLE
jgi:hypothetical protein